MLLALALAALQSPLVTFETPGISVKDFCAYLSQATGQRVIPRDEIRDDRLAIRLAGVPLPKVLEQLCWVERATLQKDGAELNLKPDQVAWANLRAEVLKDQTARTKASIDRVIALLDDQPLDEAKAREIDRKHRSLQKQSWSGDVSAFVRDQDEQFRFPIGQALIRILATIPVEDIVAMGIENREVWSTQPTPIEHGLGIAGEEILSRLRRDEQVWQDATSSVGTASNGSAIALLTLMVLGPHDGYAVLDIEAFDDHGRGIAGLIGTLEPPEALKIVAERQSFPTPKPEWRPFSKLNREFCNFLSYGNGRALGSAVEDPDFSEAFFDPEHHDPVDLTAGASLLNLGKSRNEQVIAQENVDEIRSLVGQTIRGDQQDVAAIEQRLLHPEPWSKPQRDAKAEGGWLLVRSSDPDEEARSEFSRKDLGEFLRKVRNDKSVTFDAISELAAGCDDFFGPRWLGYLYALPEVVPGLGGATLMTAPDWPLKSFYGRLSSLQKEEAATRGLPLQECSPDALHAAWREIEAWTLSSQGKVEPKGAYRESWILHPTNGIPNGLPGGGVCYLSKVVGEALKVTFGEGEGGYYTSEQLAKRLHPRKGQERMNSYDLMDVQPISDTAFKFRFAFPGGLSVTYQIHDYDPSGGKVKTLDELPPSILNHINAEISKLEKSPR